MAAKAISFSTTLGGTYSLIPGSQGSFKYNGSNLDDTVFGQLFQSSFPGLIDWEVACNAVYKGFAGYMATIKKISGSSVTFTTEAMTSVTSKIYRITNAVKSIWDRAATTNVFDNAVNQNANVLFIDYLTGTVTFKSTYTVVGPVTVTGKYFATAVIASARSYTLHMTAASIDTSTLDTVQANSGHRTSDLGLKTVSIDLSDVYNVTNAFKTLVAGRAETIIEICPDGAGQTLARGYFRPMTQGQQGNVGALEEETVTFTLSVPTDVANIELPFSFDFRSSTLATAVQTCINNFIDGTALYVQYLSDGVAGIKGLCNITDLTLSGGIDSMNDFSITVKGSDTYTAV